MQQSARLPQPLLQLCPAPAAAGRLTHPRAIKPGPQVHKVYLHRLSEPQTSWCTSWQDGPRASEMLPTTRPLWVKLRMKLNLAETVALLKNEALMGYSDQRPRGTVDSAPSDGVEQVF